MSHGNQRHQRCDFSRGAAGWVPPPPPPTNVGWGVGGCPAPPLRHPAFPPCRADLGVSRRLWGGDMGDRGGMLC